MRSVVLTINCLGLVIMSLRSTNDNPNKFPMRDYLSSFLTGPSASISTPSICFLNSSLGEVTVCLTRKPKLLEPASSPLFLLHPHPISKQLRAAPDFESYPESDRFSSRPPSPSGLNHHRLLPGLRQRVASQPLSLLPPLRL